MKTIALHKSPHRGLNTDFGPILLGITLLFTSSVIAADSTAPTAEERQRIEQALPAKAQVQPGKPRRLLIFSRNVGYGGHRLALFLPVDITQTILNSLLASP